MPFSRKKLRRQRLMAAEFPDQWLRILDQNVWQYQSLEPQKQQRVRQCVQVMSAEKFWEGIDGFDITEEVKVTIAGTASLLQLGMSTPFFFDRVSTIIVAARPMQNRKMRDGYLVDETESYYSGQAWQGGPLVFSWPDVLAGSRNRGDGFNVVIHEFAHHIDGLDGEMGGMPPISSAPLRNRWRQVFSEELQRLHLDIVHQRRPAIDPYASTNAAEFFAVVSENFFDCPHRLKERLPAVFDVLKDYYQVDPTRFA